MWTNSLTEVWTRGEEGVKKSENFADVLNGSSLVKICQKTNVTSCISHMPPFSLQQGHSPSYYRDHPQDIRHRTVQSRRPPPPQTHLIKGDPDSATSPSKSKSRVRVAISPIQGDNMRCRRGFVSNPIWYHRCAAAASHSSSCQNTNLFNNSVCQFVLQWILDIWSTGTTGYILV